MIVTDELSVLADLVPLAGDIREQIGPDACVYLAPDDEAVSNLYYLLNCLPPRYWVFTGYPWHSIDRIASRVLETVQQAPPEWVAYFPGRWLVEQHNPKLIAYIQDHYELISTLSWDQGEVQLMRRIH